MGSYSALRDAARESHEGRQRRFGGGVSDDAEDRQIAAKAVHAHEKHDHKGEPLTKLKRGGHQVEGRAAGGRRLDRKGKHKGTTVNIIMGGGQGDQQAAQQAHQAGMQQGVQLGARAAAAKLAGAGGGPPPGMAPPGAMPPGAPPRPPIAGMGPGGPPPPGAMPPGAPPMMPGRKRGGRAGGGEAEMSDADRAYDQTQQRAEFNRRYHNQDAPPERKRGGRAPGESMKFGAGSGEGRLEKEAMVEHG